MSNNRDHLVGRLTKWTSPLPLFTNCDICMCFIWMATLKLQMNFHPKLDFLFSPASPLYQFLLLTHKWHADAIKCQLKDRKWVQGSGLGIGDHALYQIMAEGSVWTRMIPSLPSFTKSHNIDLIKQISKPQVLCRKYTKRTRCIALTSGYGTTFYLHRFILCWLFAQDKEPLDAVTSVQPGSGLESNGWFTRAISPPGLAMGFPRLKLLIRMCHSCLEWRYSITIKILS